MDLLGRALAKIHLSEQGYFVSFDVSCPGDDAATGPHQFDIVALRVEEGRVVRAAVGCLRGWWQSQTHLTPSVVRTHMLPGLAEALSDDALAALRRALGIAHAPIDRLLFFGHASPEKSTEAEEMLRRHGIETVYLERVAAKLALAGPGRAAIAEPLLAQVMGILRGTMRDDETQAREEAEPREAVEVPVSPQLAFELFPGDDHEPTKGRTGDGPGLK